MQNNLSTTFSYCSSYSKSIYYLLKIIRTIQLNVKLHTVYRTYNQLQINEQEEVLNFHLIFISLEKL